MNNPSYNSNSILRNRATPTASLTDQTNKYAKRTLQIPVTGSSEVAIKRQLFGNSPENGARNQDINNAQISLNGASRYKLNVPIRGASSTTNHAGVSKIKAGGPAINRSFDQNDKLYNSAGKQFNNQIAITTTNQLAQQNMQLLNNSPFVSGMIKRKQGPNAPLSMSQERGFKGNNDRKATHKRNLTTLENAMPQVTNNEHRPQQAGEDGSRNLQLSGQKQRQHATIDISGTNSGQRTTVARPKTSSGFHNGGGMQTIGTSKQIELKKELEKMVMENKVGPKNSDFIIKRGDRNEGLRNYLRRSMDNTNRGESNLTIMEPAQPINTTQSNVNGFRRKKSGERRLNTQTMISIENVNASSGIAGGYSPEKSGTSKHSEQKKTATENGASNILAEHLAQAPTEDTQQNRTIQKIREKAHMRSLTAHKGNRPPSQGPGVSQLKPTQDGEDSKKMDHGQAQSEERKVLKPMTNEAIANPHATITVDKSNEKPASSLENKSPTQTRHNTRNNENRASISYEESTGPAQNTVTKKIDNCVTKFAFATKTGFSPSNPYKVNQDSFLALPHLGEYRRTHFFAVADGHGQYGKEVSEFIKRSLAQKVEHDIKQTFDVAKQNQRVVDSTEVKDVLTQSFRYTNDSLYSSSGLDLNFSGSTCVSILIVGNKVFCANVGDSRAVLAREFDKQLCGFPLNRDHKADEDDERDRIIRNNGRIDAFRDHAGRPMGPLRVWHLHENIPGLAMTRSFGDKAAADVGVIAEPGTSSIAVQPPIEILEMNLCESDKFIVLASDGVWEFLSNDEVVQIIRPHYENNSAEKAAEALIREALRKWKQEESVVDDITCIIIFLCV